MDFILASVVEKIKTIPESHDSERAIPSFSTQSRAQRVVIQGYSPRLGQVSSAGYFGACAGLYALITLSEIPKLSWLAAVL